MSSCAVFILCLLARANSVPAFELRLPGTELSSLLIALESSTDLKANLGLSKEQKNSFLALFSSDNGYEASRKAAPEKPDASVSLLDSYEAKLRDEVIWTEGVIRKWGECLSPTQIRLLRKYFLKDKGGNSCGPFLNSAILDYCGVSVSEQKPLIRKASDESKMLNRKLTDARRMAVQNVIDVLDFDLRVMFARYAGKEYTPEVSIDQLPAQEDLQLVPFPRRLQGFLALSTQLSNPRLRDALGLSNEQAKQVGDISKALYAALLKRVTERERMDLENRAYQDLMAIISPEQHTAAIRTLSCIAFEKDFVTPFSDQKFVSFLNLNEVVPKFTLDVAETEAAELQASEDVLNQAAVDMLIGKLPEVSAAKMHGLLEGL